MIPFNLPFVPKASKRYALKALESQHHQGDGKYTNKSSNVISNIVGGGRVLLTPSCTHALELASMLMNLGPGDEVILPSFTFTSAATAITKFGATPIFVDIRNETKGIDLEQVERSITSRTKAISWVNYAGVAPEIDKLKHLAKEFDLFLIEDNAHGFGGLYKGRPLGSFGDFATLSFHATKNVQCGEGGALVINNSDFIERAEVIREKGTDRSKFMRGEVNKYQWIDQGSSYLMAEVLAAVLLGQLESFEFIQKERIKIWDFYKSNFVDREGIVVSMKHPEQYESSNVAHLFYIEIANGRAQELSSRLYAESKICANLHYQTLHDSKAGSLYASGENSDLKNSERAAKSILRLPIWIGLTEKNLERIVASLNSELDRTM